MAIGMPTLSTIHPDGINNVWPKVFSSEDVNSPCNANICIEDIRYLIFYTEWGGQDVVPFLPELEAPFKFDMPLQANFKVYDESNPPNLVKTVNITQLCKIEYEKPLPTHSPGSEYIAEEWYVGDTHIHSSSGNTRMSQPSYDGYSSNGVDITGCPKRCECGDDPDPASLSMPGGPSIYQRAEECRELNLDFGYIADHGVTGDVDTYNKAITPYYCTQNYQTYCPGPVTCPAPLDRCVCTRATDHISAIGHDVIMIGATETAFRSYESVNCSSPYSCTGRVANYYGSGCNPFSENKLNTLDVCNDTAKIIESDGTVIPNNPQASNYGWKYISSILSQPHSNNCGTYIDSGSGPVEVNSIITETEDLLMPNYSSEPHEMRDGSLDLIYRLEGAFGGFHHFPWQYPESMGICDPWGE